MAILSTYEHVDELNVHWTTFTDGTIVLSLSYPVVSYYWLYSLVELQWISITCPIFIRSYYSNVP